MEQINEYSKEVVDRFIRSMGYDPAHIDRDKRMAFTKTTRFQQFAARMAGGDAGVREGLSPKTLKVLEQASDSPRMTNRPYTKGLAQSRTHTKDMALKRSVHVNKPQLPVKTESHTHVVHTMELGNPKDKPGKPIHITATDNKDAWNKATKAVDKIPGHYIDKVVPLSESMDEACDCERKKQLSKSARIIKSIYKKHKVVKEEIYDHEKDDKDGTTYGKTPKFKPAKDEGGVGDSKAQASAILTGGSTLTGQDRDTVEIDPVLKRAKPGSPNSDAGDEKR